MQSAFEKLKHIRTPSEKKIVKETSIEDSNLNYNYNKLIKQTNEKKDFNGTINNFKKLSNKKANMDCSDCNGDCLTCNSLENKPIQETIIRRSSEALRIPTGINGFDQMISGGYKKGSINLISGGPGTGKTIFAMEFIVNGIKLFNETGIYISFDEKKESIYESARMFGWDLEKYEREEKLIFVEYGPEQLLKILEEGGGLLDNLMSKSKAKRLVIDSISTFLLMSSSEIGRREQLISFFRMLTKWGVTSLLTNEYTPISGNEISKESLSIAFETDSITQMYYVHDNIGEERKRLIEVYKMRWTNHVTKAVSYNITSKGIEIINLKK
jgi:KaiC/GvpD/RAD55 family RecA-like ATPase